MDLVSLVQAQDLDDNTMTGTFETDVLIVGGGPAGSSTALSLLRYTNFKVVVLEQSNLNTMRVGEQVNASIFDILEYMGITKNDFDNETFLPAFDSLAAWGNANVSSRHSIFSTQHDSYQLDRENFDLLLLKKVSESGATVLPRTKALEFSFENDFWEVLLEHQIKGSFKIKAKYIVDASGRQSYVARKVGLDFEQHDELVAVGTFLHFDKNITLTQEIFVETVEDGWWYFATLPDNKVVVSLFSDADIVKEKQLHKAEHWVKEILKTKHIQKKLPSSVTIHKIWTRNAFSHFVRMDGQNHFLAVGDAVASFDPISSMGIGFAMSSGSFAAKAIADHSSNPNALKVYEESIQNILSNYNETKGLYYRKEQRWPDSSFWKKRISF